MACIPPQIGGIFPYTSNRPEAVQTGGPCLPMNYRQQFAGTINGLYPEATVDGPDRTRVNTDNLSVIAGNYPWKTSVLFPNEQS